MGLEYKATNDNQMHSYNFRKLLLLSNIYDAIIPIIPSTLLRHNNCNFYTVFIVLQERNFSHIQSSSDEGRWARNMLGKDSFE